MRKNYVAFGNSNNKMAAETSVSAVVVSAFSYRAVAVSGVTGVEFGICIISLIGCRKES